MINATFGSGKKSCLPNLVLTKFQIFINLIHIFAKCKFHDMYMLYEENGNLLESRVSEICVKWICVNQGVGVIVQVIK
jgi:hypothetical protein